jgi:hypothetical protein
VSHTGKKILRSVVNNNFMSLHPSRIVLINFSQDANVIIIIYYQFEEQRHEPVLLPEIYVASLSVVGFPTAVELCFTVCSVEPPTALIVVTNFQKRRDVFAINF